jgi:uncharacterized membrane protein
VERLKTEARGLAGALGDRAVDSLHQKVEDTAGRLKNYADGGGGPGLMAAITGVRNLADGRSPLRAGLGAGMAGAKEKAAGLFGQGSKGGRPKKLNLTNIVESLDVGVPIKLAYNQWTQYSDFPKFTKKVESVDQPEETKTNWKAQIFLSHRSWEATIIEQVPDERIIWRSKGAKGYVDGAVTFHELAPRLTRILMVMEYHPQGFFEHTGNLWRAQGRRARLEFKHFRRHMMTEGVLHADEIEGWRGTIHDGEVVESHEDAVAREEKEGSQRDESRRSADGQADETAQSRAESGETKDREPVTGGDFEDEGAENGDRRAERAEAPAGRPRSAQRPASTGRATRGAATRGVTRGTERRQRAGATAQRGGSK